MTRGGRVVVFRVTRRAFAPRIILGEPEPVRPRRQPVVQAPQGSAIAAPRGPDRRAEGVQGRHGERHGRGFGATRFSQNLP